MDKIKEKLRKNKIGYQMGGIVLGLIFLLTYCGSYRAPAQEIEFIVIEKQHLEERDMVDSVKTYDINLGWYSKVTTVHKPEQYILIIERKDGSFNIMDDKRIEVDKETYDKYEINDIYIVKKGG